MLNSSFSLNFLKIYLWKGIGLLVNLGSLFVVIPKLSSDPEVFGVYAICASFSIYLSYADIGFYRAGVKFAAECFAKGDRQGEQRFLGFSLFILTLFVCLIAAGFLYLSYHPTFLIKGIDGTERVNVASSLLMIQAFFSFNSILQRFVDAVLNIRLETYVSQRILIVGGIVKILSVFYFFGNGRYDLVGYFLFIKSVDLVAHMICILIIRKRLNYNLTAFLRSFRFDKAIYNRSKALAFSSFYVTLLWITYYEMDQLAIGSLIGANEVAVYAVAFTILTYYRTIASIIFAPFQSRFNHIKGLGQEEELKKYYYSVIRLTMPVVVFSVTPILLLSEEFVMAWVGSDYDSSVPLLIFLMLSNLFLFIGTPGSYLIVTMEKVRVIYALNTVMSLVYWLGIVVFINQMGVLAFAVFKFISFFIATLF